MENNWEQVKDIFQAVLDRPAIERESFLAEACKGNKNLSEEVRGLLDSFEENDSFFEQAAIGEVAEFIVSNKDRLTAGEKLGRYVIKDELGAGGMGEVFLAKDTELGRLVALKVLSPVFSSEKDRIRRFVREAKSASALNHPNILTIYEIGQREDLHFIATEYVKGETLRQRQKRKPFGLRELLDIFIQAATALNAAHEARIVHRDIKPENIMIREDGLVKVLDFGLAKLVEQTQSMRDDGTMFSTQLHTTPGLIMGTVAYMSPEQTRGQEVDARTDIWSLGVCLYEMTAGFMPFAGDTVSDTIAAILKSEPLPLGRNAPGKLSGIIQKTLQKNLENRYQNIDELLNDLKKLRQDLDAGTETEILHTRETFGGEEKLFIGDFSVVQSTKENQFDTALDSKPENHSSFGFKNKLLMAAAAFTVLICVSAALYYLPAVFRQNSTFETMRFSRLTFTGNIAGEQAAISPDGKYAAFVIQETENQSLWVRQIATSVDVRITQPSKNTYGGLSFSRDGNYVYYSATDENDAVALYRIPIVGGEAQKLIDNVERSVSFSPDGNRMVLVQNETSLMTANADGSDLKQLATARDGRRWNLTAWSPDGKTIVCSIFSSADSNNYLVEVSAADGTETPFNFSPWMRVSGIGWLADNRTLIISGRDPETKLSQIWSVSREGKATRITNDLNSYLGIGLTADGKSIVGIQHERVSNVWLASNSDSEPARQVTFDKDKDEGMSGVSLTPDGKIVYTTRIMGAQDLWITNSDGSGNRRLTSDARSNFSPAVSPDNRYIAFISDRSGNANIWRMDLDGGNVKQLNNMSGISLFPVFSPDGKWIIYQFDDAANNSTVWKINVDGGEPIQLTDIYSRKPVISPDGNFFACYYGKQTPENQTKIAVIPFSGGKPSKIFDLPSVMKSAMFRWTGDGKSLIYINKDGQTDNLWKKSFDNRPPEPFTNFKSEQIFRFDYANDQLAIARGSETSDVVMISNFR